MKLLRKFPILFTLLLMLQGISFYSFSQISADNTRGCVPLVIEFQVEDYAYESIAWEAGDGQTSTADKPTFVFEEVGQWAVNAVLTGSDGQTTTLTFDEMIVANEKPQVDFSLSTTTSCVGQDISFYNSTQNADSYLWSFGDGNQSTDTNPVHQYQEEGTYTITLTAEIEGSCQEIQVLDDAIQIVEASEVNVLASRNTQCINESNPIEFTLEGAATEVQWNFGDGATGSGSSTEHLYDEIGEYNVEVSYVNNLGCSISTSLNSFITVENISAPTIETSATLICLGDEIILAAKHPAEGNFQWTVNNTQYNGKEISISPTQGGEANVALTYFNAAGCSISIEDPGLFNVQEVEAVSINYSEHSGCEPFVFSASNETQTAVSYKWKVNGELINGSSLDYTFEEAGDYTIIAITEYESGCILETKLSDQIQVFESETIVESDQWKGCAPFTTEFRLLDEEAENIRWTWGSTHLSGNDVEASFDTPGIYYPEVSYINKHGCEIQYVLEAPVTVLSRGISMGDPQVIESCTSAEVYFEGNMGYDFWEWDFGDGNTSTKSNPVHSYSESGTYEVSLKTNNKFGCETTIERYNIIEIPNLDVETSFTVTKGDECGYFSVQINADLATDKNVRWYHEETLLGTGNSLEASFISLADVGITLNVASELGQCTKSKSIIIPNPWPNCVVEIEDETEESEMESPIGKFEFSSCNFPYSIDLENPIPEAVAFEWRYANGNTHSQSEFTETFTAEGEYIIGYWAEVEADSIVLVEDYIKVTISQANLNFDFEVKKACDGFELFLSAEEENSDQYNWKIGNEPIELSENGSYLVENEGLYSVSLSFVGSNNCSSTNIKNIYVGNGENKFSFPKSICLGENVSLEHALKGFEEVRWDMGNNDVIDDFSSGYNYPKAGEYQVEAIGIDFEGCEYRFPLPDLITVHNPIAEFSANKTYGCGETEIKFRNMSEGADSWFWDFGNGYTSTEENPAISFSPGKYEIVMVANYGACADIVTKSDYIEIDELISDFSFEYEQPCLPVTVQFSDASVNAVAWFWDFGDGSTSTLQNPTHTYHEIPSSKIKLTVENEKGCKKTHKQSVNFIFTAQFKSDINEVCLGNSVQFSALSKNAVSWLWDFGDGQSSTEKNPKHQYLSEGIYDVQLIAESEEGCKDILLQNAVVEVFPVKADFELGSTISSNCVPVQVEFKELSQGAVSYLWDFGDGNTSSVANPLHLYKDVGDFDVKLVITNELGCQDSMIKEQLVKVSGPETKFEVESKTVCLPETANFIDTSISAVEWKWIFGDGNTSEEQNPQHLYEEPGLYNVTLIAKNETGCEQIFKVKNIKVLPTPDVSFDMQVSGECYPVEVKLTNTSSNLLKASYSWDLSSGQTSTEENPTFLVKEVGDFEVSLVVKNDNGCSVSYTHENTIFVRDTVEHNEAEVNKVIVENNKVHFELNSYEYNNISHYNIYRDSPEGFNLLKSIDVNGASARRIMYDDQSCQPQKMSHKYIFQAVAYCKDTVATSRLTVYNTLLLEKDSDAEAARKVEWNKSLGFKIDNQRIFRKSKGNAEWKEIAILKNDVLFFQDHEDLCPGVYEYRVGAFDKNQLRSISNYIEFEVPDDIYLNQVAEIKNTTVLESGEVFTEWTVPEEGRDRITAFEIYRSINDGEYEYHDSAEPHEQFYIDEDSDTEKNSYNYQVKVVNDCSIDTKNSEKSNTVLLKKNVQFRKYELKWNAYEGWEQGVEKYIIQRLNANGVWETVEEVSGDQLNTIIKDTEDQ